jgi:hypothetical protein
MSSSATLPNLIIIGAMKCGTTSLHHYLDSHPNIGMARNQKETNFFRDGSGGNWHRGVDWYRRQFDPALPVRGDASPLYTNLPESKNTAERIHDLVPEAKLIYLVRDPLDRMVSDFVHQRALRNERRSFEEALLDPESPFIARSSYALQLKPFLRLTPRDRILVDTQENLLRDREATLRRIFRFLNVDDSFTSPEFERKWQQTEGMGGVYSVAAPAMARLPKGGGSLPRSLRWPVTRLLRSRLVSGRKPSKPAYDHNLRELVVRRLKGDVEEFRQLTGLSFEGWSV